MKRGRIPFGLILLLVVGVSVLIFGLCYRYDNKYQVREHPARLGLMRLDMTQYEKSPLLYLIEGWAVYRDQLLTPAEIASHTPDHYQYIGRYGGFDWGNPSQSPHGRATYRLLLAIDEQHREYALELPEIFSRYQLYINGELKAQREMPPTEGPLPAPESWLLSFYAEDFIEIIIAVESENSIYSGLVNIPALGSPQAVGQILTQRLLWHGGAMAVALIIAAFCLMIGLGFRYSKPYHLLGLLCLCFIGIIAYPVLQALGYRSYTLMERLCYYGLFLTLVLLEARLCQIPRKIWLPLALFGGLVLLSLFWEDAYTWPQAGARYLYSGFLSLYKWLTAGWLLVCSAWALWRRKPHVKAMLLGSAIFSVALVMDRFLPFFEPIRLGWHVEMAGFCLILLVAGELWQDTVKVYRDSLILEADKIALEETNRLKTEFLSAISHDLQMPLTVVSGYAQLAGEELWDEPQDKPEIQDQLQRIVREAERMEHLVTQLLDITYIESNQFRLQPKLLRADELLQQTVAIYFPILNEQGNTLTLDLAADLPPVWADEERLSQVLINLLSNACRHTKNGEIRLSTAVAGNAVALTVQDNGSGIAWELQPQLFQRYQTKAQDRSTSKSNGLGLSLCKRIIELHGGRIDLVSEPGHGTTVTFTLPIQTQHQEDADGDH